jgi:SAM-dependent methyltransferase
MKPLDNSIPRRLIGVLCPYCGADGFNAFAFYTRVFYRCNACDLIYRHRPDKDQAAILSYFRHQYFDEHAGDQITRQQAGFYREILHRIERKIKPGSLLDVGCGCGYFLKEASDRQWAVFGIDPSQKSIDTAQRLIENRVLCGTVDDLPPDRSYDAISLINVLDHMASAFHDLEKIIGRLKRRGLLYIRVPNGFFHLTLLNIFKGLPGFINPYLVFHEYSFTGAFLTRCLADNGFTDIEVRCARLSGDDLYQQGGSISRFAKTLMIRVISGFVKSIEVISHGRLLLGPSIEVTAIKR